MGQFWATRRARRASRRMVLGTVGILVGLMVVTGGVLAARHLLSDSSHNPWPYAPQDKKAEILAAVGDISCQPSPQPGQPASQTCSQGTASTERNAAQAATSQQVENMKPNLIAVLGDEQYQTGNYSDFENSYDKYWGATKFLQRPVPGNHEFYDYKGLPGVRGLGYFDYYNGLRHNTDGSEADTTVNSVTQPAPQPQGQAGPFGATGNGWYSYNLGSWHLIALNAECADEAGGCSNASGTWFNSETQWLAGDLAADNKPCTLAYWHQPTFGSDVSPTDGKPGTDGVEGGAADAWWQLLYKHHADLILNGHDHVYTRFAPMDPGGNYDPNGIREFIIGTGGESLDPINSNTPNYEAGTNLFYGVMKLTLKPDGYTWDYQSAMKSQEAPLGTPSSYSDTGSGSCHGGSDADSNS